MRYYEIHLPGGDPIVTSNVRQRLIPNSAEVWVTITDRDGSVCDTYQLPVENGRVRFGAQAKHRPSMWYGGARS